MADLSHTADLVENCWKFLVLGLVQGLTEFLPISSTAHLKAIPMILGWDDPGISVTAVLQLGSIIAVMTYFRKDLKDVIKGISIAFRQGQWREPNARLGIAICTGTIPVLLAGIFIKFVWPQYEDSPFRSIPSIALISLLMAGLLAFAEMKGIQKKRLEDVSGKEGLIVGLGQMLALIPGVSRSGITLSVSLISGWKRQDAARFSFLIGIPAITLAGLAELKNAFASQSEVAVGIIPLLIGISSSAIVSWLTIDWFLEYLQRNNTWIFVIYRLLFGASLLVWWALPAQN